MAGITPRRPAPSLAQGRLPPLRGERAAVPPSGARLANLRIGSRLEAEEAARSAEVERQREGGRRRLRESMWEMSTMSALQRDRHLSSPGVMGLDLAVRAAAQPQQGGGDAEPFDCLRLPAVVGQDAWSALFIQAFFAPAEAAPDTERVEESDVSSDASTREPSPEEEDDLALRRGALLATLPPSRPARAARRGRSTSARPGSAPAAVGA